MRRASRVASIILEVSRVRIVYRKQVFLPEGLCIYIRDQCAALGCNIRPRQPGYRLQTKLLVSGMNRTFREYR